MALSGACCRRSTGNLVGLGLRVWGIMIQNNPVTFPGSYKIPLRLHLAIPNSIISLKGPKTSTLTKPADKGIPLQPLQRLTAPPSPQQANQAALRFVGRVAKAENGPLGFLGMDGTACGLPTRELKGSESNSHNKRGGNVEVKGGRL